MDDELESRATGGEGPGLEPRTGVDPAVVVAGIFTLTGFTPDAVFDATIGYSHFGPLAWSAVLAMVGVLFSVIAMLRGYDTDDKPLKRWGAVLFAIGMLRLFLSPLL